MFAHNDLCHAKAKLNVATKPSANPASVNVNMPKAISAVAPTAATPRPQKAALSNEYRDAMRLA